MYTMCAVCVRQEEAWRERGRGGGEEIKEDARETHGGDHKNTEAQMGREAA